MRRNKSKTCRRNAITMTCAAAAAALCAIAPGATAGDQSDLRPSAQATAEVTTIGSAVAHCPAGKVISGGFAAPGFSKEDLPTVRVNSEAVGRRDWKIDAVLFGDGDENSNDPTGQSGSAAPRTGTIISHAYCAKLSGRLKARQTTVEVQPGTLGTATARCRRSERVIAGGFAGLDDSSPGAMIVLSSRKAGGRAWTVQGFVRRDGEQPSSPGPLTAIAYCLKHAPRLVERSQQASVGHEQFRTIDVACPLGSKALSGGFDANVGPLGEDVSASGVVESFRMGGARGWTTSAISIDDGLGATMTGFAYCAELS